MKASLPLGVDIVEWKKARAFYGAHRGRLDSFLSPSEMKFIGKNQKPYEGLATLFAAKEAVFKALGVSWFGPEKFRKIRIRPVSADTFLFTGTRGRKFRITTQKSSRHVVACCSRAR